MPAPTVTRTTRGTRLRVDRMTLVVADSADDVPAAGTAILSSLDAANVARVIATAVIGDLAGESVLAIFLDARRRVLGFSTVCQGTLNAARFVARDVLAPALVANAHGIIITHNHPSGECAPSRADRVVTASLRDACRLMGVTLFDHLIVNAAGDHYSFADAESWTS